MCGVTDGIVHRCLSFKLMWISTIVIQDWHSKFFKDYWEYWKYAPMGLVLWPFSSFTSVLILIFRKIIIVSMIVFRYFQKVISWHFHESISLTNIIVWSWDSMFNEIFFVPTQRSIYKLFVKLETLCFNFELLRNSIWLFLANLNTVHNQHTELEYLDLEHQLSFFISLQSVVWWLVGKFLSLPVYQLLMVIL